MGKWTSAVCTIHCCYTRQEFYLLPFFFNTLQINLCIFVSSEFLSLSNHIEILK